jgi:phosphatidylserine/phosphatidylglycerophosphate/cardiolipin synthase-like enzyme
MREIEHTPDNGIIRICMYNFEHEPIYKALINKALNHNVSVRVILDNSASWTDANVNAFIKGVKESLAPATKAGRNPDYRIKIVNSRSMDFFERSRKLDNGKIIYGTMHQKFGIFQDAPGLVPIRCFAGSANTSASAEEIYAENRIFFNNAPVVCKIYQNQFARLWNYFCVPRYGKEEPEAITEITEKVPFEIIFNGEFSNSILNPEYNAIDRRILQLLEQVEPAGSLDVMMFSFTHWDIAHAILKAAQKNPNARFRLLFDQSMIKAGPDRIGIMPPYLEEKAAEMGLDNISIRYKFRTNAYGWDKEKKCVDLIHFRSHLLHHKVMIVNNEKLIFGSYNWSASAEERNFEDVMVFNSKQDFGKDVITRFKAEFEYLWKNLIDTDRGIYPDINGRVISGPQGRKLAQKILTALSDRNISQVRYYLDRFGPMGFSDLSKRFYRRKDFKTPAFSSMSSLYRALAEMTRLNLVKNGLDKNNKRVYSLAD